MRYAVAALALMLVASPVFAEEQADAPMATAGASGSPPVDTATQIERYLADAAAEADRPPLEDGPRKIHGEVSLSVGTGGYRSGYATAQIPLGESGTLGLAYGQTDYGENGGYYYGGPGGPCLRGPDGMTMAPTPNWSDRLRPSSHGCPLN